MDCEVILFKIAFYGTSAVMDLFTYLGKCWVWITYGTSAVMRLLRTHCHSKLPL